MSLALPRPTAPGLPRLPQDLSVRQRGTLAAAVLLAHGLVAWGLWHAAPRTPTVVEPPVITANLLVDNPRPETRSVVTEAPAPATTPPMSPVPVVAKPVQPPVLASARPVATADVPLVLPVPDSKPLTPAVAQPLAPAATPAAHAPANPAPVTEPQRPAQTSPKELPMSAVRYLVEPPQVYPRASRDLGESGVVQLKVLVDEDGRPKDVLVSKGSGFPRLDRQAVLNMKSARFQPHVEAGVPRAVWVPAEIVFNLE